MRWLQRNYLPLQIPAVTPWNAFTLANLATHEPAEQAGGHSPCELFSRRKPHSPMAQPADMERFDFGSVESESTSLLKGAPEGQPLAFTWQQTPSAKGSAFSGRGGHAGPRSIFTTLPTSLAG